MTARQWGLALLVVLGLGACGGGGDDAPADGGSSTDETTATTAAGDGEAAGADTGGLGLCELVPLETVEAIFEQTELTAVPDYSPDQNGRGRSRESCSYPYASGSSLLDVGFTVEVIADESEAVEQFAYDAGDLPRLTGFGDEAAKSSGAGLYGRAKAVFRKGNAVVTISFDVNDVSTSDAVTQGRIDAMFEAVYSAVEPKL